MQETGYRRRLSRRRALQGSALAGSGIVAAVLIAGGGREQPAGPVSGKAQLKDGGAPARRNAIGMTRSCEAGPDPHPPQSTYTNLVTQSYQTSLRRNPHTFIVEPELAQNWDMPPVNGRELTAGEVIFSLNRVRTEEPQCQSHWLHDVVAGGGTGYLGL